VNKQLGEWQLKKLRQKVAWGLSAFPVGLEVESNLDVQLVDGEVRTLKQREAKWVISVRPGDILSKPAQVALGKSGGFVTALLEELPVSAEAKGKFELEEEAGHRLTVKIGEAEELALKFAETFEFEVSTAGNMKLTLRPFPDAPLEVETEANAFEGEMMAGFKISGELVAKRLEKWAEDFHHQLHDPAYLASNPGVKRFLVKYGGSASAAAKAAAFLLAQFELEVEVGYVGASEESILAVVSLAPGFFERRSIQDLFCPETLWNELTLDEQVSLGRLGWNSLSWDMKYVRGDLIPKSADKSPYDLNSEEKIGIVHLGFRRYAEYATAVRHARHQYGGAEESESGGEEPEGGNNSVGDDED
jgi:hypothetical protein